MKKRSFIVKAATALVAGSFVLAGCTTTTNQGSPTAQSPGSSKEAKRKEINAGVEDALQRMYAQVPGSRDLAGRARGILVFPKAIKAGFMIGAEYGTGALRAGGATQGYYRMIAGSFGLQAGAQSRAVIILFMTDDALNTFRSRQGWSLGGDASVAVAKMGATGAIDTTTATKPVQVIVMTNAGLMGDLSLEGTKISRIEDL